MSRLREYESYDDAVNDPDLDLRVIWRCEHCGDEREERPYYNEGGRCACGGRWIKAGESYRG